MFPRNNHRIIFEYIKERTDSFALRVQNDRLFSRCERRKARGIPFFLFRGITDSFALRAQNDRSFVIAVRMSGGHLCEAEAPTEPAGETAARCAAIRSSFKGNTDSFVLYVWNDKEKA